MPEPSTPPTSVPGRMHRFDGAAARFFDRVAVQPWVPALLLLALTLMAYLPGVLALPPVDRTEVIWAEGSRAMLERGELIDATFQGERFAYRPIGTYWLQMGAGWLAGGAARADITTYRLPSLLGVILAVLATFWLLAPLLGRGRALIAAALFAICVPVAIEAQLAIAEGPTLAAAVAAQLALLRIYCAGGSEETRGLALLFWAAQGIGMLLNALAVPILSLSTILALAVFDREVSWLKRLHPFPGVPLMLVLGAPWLLVRAHLDGGVPFADLGWGDLLAALGGSQAMKFKAAPLSFTLALVIGFLPGALLLIPALKGLWRERTHALPRFLLAWLIGYLVYLELISSKPALYTVPVMFPLLGAAVALAMAHAAEAGRSFGWPKGALVAPAPVVGIGVLALFAAVLWSLGERPTPAVLVGGIVVAALLAASAHAGRLKLASAWLALGIPGFALFLGFTFGVLLPSLDKPWPSTRVDEAIAGLRPCAPGPVALVGLREPSSVFVLGSDTVHAKPDDIAEWMARGERHVAVIEERWHDAFLEALAEKSAPLPERLGCVEAFNVMRGCSLVFSLYVTGPAEDAARCRAAVPFACRFPQRKTPIGQPATSRCH